MKKLTRKAGLFLSGLITALLILGTCQSAFAATVTGLGENFGYIFNGAEDPHNLNLYRVDGELCYCLHPDRYVPTWVDDPVSEENVLIKAILLLGPGGKYYNANAASQFGISFYNHAKEYAKGMEGWSNDLGIQFGDWENVWIDAAGDYELDVMWVHYLASYVYNDFAFTSDQVPDSARKVMAAEVKKIQEILEDENSTLALNAKAATFITYAGSSSDYQTLGRLYAQPDVKEQGRFKIVKTSAEPEITDGNSNYSLDGAVYGIYSDADCTKLVEELTLKLDGDSASATSSLLDKGTYYVKEITAPKGYELSSEVYKADTKTNQTVEVTFKDTPYGGGEIVIKKIADDENADLTGVKFKIDFYDTEEAEEPLRTWEIQTLYNEEKEGYYAVLDTDHLVSGELYGKLPLGVYEIYEISSVPGFSLVGRTLEIEGASESKVVEGGIILKLEQGEDGCAFDKPGTIIATNRSVSMVTEALTADTESHTFVAGKAKVVDNVTIYNLDSTFDSYYLRGTLVYKDSGEKITESTLEISAAKEELSLKNYFEFDATDMGGREVVVFEELYALNDEGEEISICKHEDLENKAQTLLVEEPEPETPEPTTTPEEPTPEEPTVVPSRVIDNPSTGDSSKTYFDMFGIALILGAAAAFTYRKIKE